MQFEFQNPCRIIFGAGSIFQLPELLCAHGRRCLLFTGRDAQRAGNLLAPLDKALLKNLIVIEKIPQEGEPTVSRVDQAVAQAREFKPDVIVGLGGGSALDLGKAVAALLTNGGCVVDYLEGVGGGKKFHLPGVPYIAIPTTAGTGSEVTRNAVIAADDRSFKKSIRSPLLTPDVALVDPALTQLLPPDLTAACGFDALSQLIESYTSNSANPLSDALALAGIRRVAQSLFTAWEDGLNAAAREDLAFAALLSGITLANAGLGAVHGLAAPLGAFFNAPHGIICAQLLPHVIEANFKALEKRGPRNGALERYSRLAQLWCGDSDDPLQLVEALQSLLATINLPLLRNFGMTEYDVPRVVANSRGSSMKFNPIELTDAELSQVLKKVI